MLSRPFVALYVAVFVATMGISMVSPLLPVYAEQLGANGIWLGLTFSAFAVVQAIFGPIVGRLSDRYPRKPFVIAGLLIYMIAALGYLTAGSFIQVISFRSFSGIGTSMIFSVARAYVGDMTPRGHEGRWFGVFATADVIGFGTGPLFAGVIRQGLGFDAVFIAMALMMGISALVVMLALPRRQPMRERHASEPKDPVRVPFRSALNDRLVLALTIHMALVSLSFGASFSFLGLRLEDDIGVNPTLIGIAFSTQDLTAGFAQPLFGRLADRFDRRNLVALGVLGLGIMLFALGLVTSYLMVVVVLFLMGAMTSLSQVAASAIQVVAGRRVGMGTVLGLGSAGNGIGIVVGSVIGGVLVNMSGIPAAFFFSGIGIAIGAPIFLSLTKGVATSEVLFDLAQSEAPAPVRGSNSLPAESGTAGGS
ncbi:MAG: MFS transporter [Dehalococcoidia bacterium]|nr:MFS transporter [Dehalococcoidia bacterium]